MAGRAHGDRGVFISLQGVNFAIRFAGAIDRVRLRRLRATANSTQPVLCGLNRDQRAVLIYAGLQFLPGAGTIARHDKFVITIQH